MNVNGVYVAAIYVLQHIEVTNYNTATDITDYMYESKFVKFAPVMLMGSTYIDLETGERYNYGVYLHTSKGSLYINRIFPYTSFIPTKKQDMSKRRILKIYNEYKNEVYNEYKNKIEKEKE